LFFFSSRRRHTRSYGDWSSDVCSSDLKGSAWKVAARYQKEKKQEIEISGDCDVFVSFNHEAPLFCAAPLGILVVLFPFITPHSKIGRASCRKDCRSRWSLYH